MTYLVYINKGSDAADTAEPKEESLSASRTLREFPS